MKQCAISGDGTLHVKARTNVYEKPKKAIPKKKLTAADTKATWLNPAANDPVDESEQTAETSNPQVVTCTTDGDFNKWLVNYDTMADINMDFARDYLLRGPPFKGSHDKNYKVSIKDTGLQWLKNPEFVEGVRDGQKFGWYVAHDIHELKLALSMPRKVDGERAWYPCDIGDVAVRYVADLIDEYTNEKDKEEERRRAEAEEKRNAREAALGRGSGRFEADDSHDINAICELMRLGGYHDWKYDQKLIASSASAHDLGPMTNTHALRVHRALRLRIVTPDQVAIGQWESDEAIRKRKLKEATAVEKKRKAEEANTEQHQEANLKRLKAKAEQAVRVLKRDDELEQPDQEDDVARISDVRPSFLVGNYPCKDTALKATTCSTCNAVVHEQFMDCSCMNGSWKQCAECHYAYCDQQGCRCNPEKCKEEMDMSEKRRGKQRMHRCEEE